MKHLMLLIQYEYEKVWCTVTVSTVLLMSKLVLAAVVCSLMAPTPLDIGNLEIWSFHRCSCYSVPVVLATLQGVLSCWRDHCCQGGLLPFWGFLHLKQCSGGSYGWKNMHIACTKTLNCSKIINVIHFRGFIVMISVYFKFILFCFTNPICLLNINHIKKYWKTIWYEACSLSLFKYIS